MEKRKFRVNILDFLILAAVILCIAGAFLRGGVRGSDEKLETQTAIISFKISNVQSATARYFSDGDPVYSETLGCSLGTIIGDSITSTPAVFYAEQGGEIVKTESGIGRVDIRGSFECAGQMSESGFLVGGTQYIAPGMTTYALMPKVNANIQITDIKLK